MALSNQANFSGSLLRAVQFFFKSLSSLTWSGLARQLKAPVKIWEIELDDQDGVSQVVVLAEFFELFG